MTDTSLPHKPKRASALLRRWAVETRTQIHAGLALQIGSVLGWICMAYGIGLSVGGVIQGTDNSEFLLLALFGAALRTLSVWGAEELLNRAGHRMKMAARKDILNKVSDVGAVWLSGDAAGARVTQIIDRTEKLSGYASNWKPGMYMAVLGPIIVLIAVAFQSWLSAALLTLSVLVLPPFIWLTASKTAAEARAQQSALDGLSGAFQARAAQAGIIRAFRAIGRESETLGRASDTLRVRTMAILRIAFLSTAVLEFFASISIALVAVYIGFKLLGVFPFGTFEQITLTEGLIVLILAPEFFAPIRKLSSLYHDRSDASAAAEFFADWIEKAPSAPAINLPKLTEAPDISFENASIAWPGHKPFLSGISLIARPGEITAIAGRSGSGKSSLLYTLLGQTQIVSGDLRINGSPLEAGTSLKESIAYVSQTPWLMEGTIRANIALARPDATESEIDDAAKRSGLLSILQSDREGLDTKVRRMGAGLSGGQRQRIAIARALLRNAPIWLLDEPTSHLDPDAEAEIFRLIQSLAADRTILIATHSSTQISAASNRLDLSARAEEITS